MDPVTIFDEWLAGRIRRVPNGFWQDTSSARTVLEEVLRRDGHALADAPMVCRRSWFEHHHMRTLLRIHRHSPYLLLTALYPGRWHPGEFPEVPKKPDIQAAAFAAAGVIREGGQHQRWRSAKLLRAERLGRCLLCRRPHLPGKRLCAYHQQQILTCERQKYRVARAQGLCYRCRTRTPYKAGACQSCYRKILVNRAREMRRHYWRNKAQGLCGNWKCNAPAMPGHVYCPEHVSEQRDRYYRLDYRTKSRQNRMRRGRHDSREKG